MRAPTTRGDCALHLPHPLDGDNVASRDLANTGAPAVTLLLWLFGIGAFAAIAIVVAPRLLRALAATVFLVVAVAVAVQATYVHSIGFQGEDRYTLPLAVGVPILAGLGIGLARDRVPGSRRLATIIVTGLAVAQLSAFAQALRRYTVGINGTIWFPWNARWHPPVPPVVLLVGFAALLCVGSVLLVRVRTDSTGPDPTRREPSMLPPSTQAR